MPLEAITVEYENEAQENLGLVKLEQTVSATGQKISKISKNEKNKHPETVQLTVLQKEYSNLNFESDSLPPKDRGNSNWLNNEMWTPAYEKVILDNIKSGKEKSKGQLEGAINRIKNEITQFEKLIKLIEEYEKIEDKNYAWYQFKKRKEQKNDMENFLSDIIDIVHSLRFGPDRYDQSYFEKYKDVRITMNTEAVHGYKMVLLEHLITNDLNAFEEKLEKYQAIKLKLEK